VFRPIPLPSEATIEHALELAREMRCTHYVISRVTNRSSNTPIVLSFAAGAFWEADGQQWFWEAFGLGLDLKSNLRTVRDWRELDGSGGRQWHPDILAGAGKVQPIDQEPDGPTSTDWSVIQ